MKYSSALLFTLLASLIFLSTANSQNQELESNKVIVVLDASGSMWGQIENNPKIEIAKTVVRDILKDWDPQVELGLTAHVIGFDIRDKEAEAQLRCLAENTGGRFMSAKDASSLKLSLDQAIKEVKTEKPVQDLKGIVKLVAVTEPGGKALDQMYWYIYEPVPEGSLNKPKQVISGQGSSPEYTLLPGKYLAKVTSVKGKAEAQKEIEIKAGKKETIEVVIAQEGIVNLVAVDEAGGKALEKIYWRVATIVPDDSIEKPQSVAQGQGAQPEYRLLPGRYMARALVSGKVIAEKEIEILAGKRIKQEIILTGEG